MILPIKIIKSKNLSICVIGLYKTIDPTYKTLFQSYGDKTLKTEMDDFILINSRQSATLNSFLILLMPVLIIVTLQARLTAL